MGTKFVLKKASSGKYHFTLITPNGEILVASELYETKDSAWEGIELFRSSIDGAQIDDHTGTNRRRRSFR